MKNAILSLLLSIPPVESKVLEISYQEKIAQGVVYGNKVSLHLERLPFKNRRGESLWLRKGKPTEYFLDMVAYALSHGYEIKLNSAYRTYEHQMRLWKQMPDIAGQPGHGGWRTHQTGCSIDISGTIKEINGVQHKTILYWWLKRFGPQFHFYNTVDDEPWHWTYMGPVDDEELEVGGD